MSYTGEAVSDVKFSVPKDPLDCFACSPRGLIIMPGPSVVVWRLAPPDPYLHICQDQPHLPAVGAVFHSSDASDLEHLPQVGVGALQRFAPLRGPAIVSVAGKWTPSRICSMRWGGFSPVGVAAPVQLRSPVSLAFCSAVPLHRCAGWMQKGRLHRRFTRIPPPSDLPWLCAKASTWAPLPFRAP